MKLFRTYTILPIIVIVGLSVLPVPASAYDFVENILWNIVVGVLGTMVALAGQLLDFAVNNFVIGFGEQFQRNGIGVAVDATWVVIRDFINMTFIFGLVYIGMKMILDSDSSNTRRWLVNLIIAALLINFSLFFTKFVVDVSNQFATAIVSEGFQTRNGDVDVSFALLDKLGVSTVFNKSNAPADSRPAGYGYIFGTALVLIIAAFVFAAGAIMLIIRFVALNLFLVFSPVMFLSWILPMSRLQGVSSKYWGDFLGRAFFAPLYLLFVYISFRILDEMSKTNAIQNNDLAGALAGDRSALIANGNDNSFAFFIFAAALLIMSLIVSNKLGADGASTAMSMGKDWSKKAQRGATRMAGGATFGLTAKAAQGTVGLGASRLAQNKKLQAWAAKSKSGEMALRGVRGVADSSFDVRRVGGFGKATGLGEGVKGGYVTREKNRAKRDEEFYKSLDQLDMDDPENKAAAAAAERQLKLEAERKLKPKIKEAEQEKERAEAEEKELAENEGKAGYEIEYEIEKLRDSIPELEKALSDGISKGLLTSQEQIQKRQEIEDKKKQLDVKESVKEKSQKLASIKKRKSDAEYKLAVGTNLSEQEKTQFREIAQQAEAEFQNLKSANTKVYQARKKIADNKIKAAQEELKEAKANAKAQAEVQIKNKSRIAYMQRLQRQANKFDPLSENSLQELQKKYGKDIKEMAKKDKEAQANKKLAAQIKAAMKDEDKEKKDEDKKDE